MNELGLKITSEAKHIQSTPGAGRNFSTEEKNKIGNAARDFESLLTSIMLKSMTESSNLFGDSGFGGDTFNVIFEQELASHMTRSKGMGIADMIYQKMTGEPLTDKQIRISAPPSKKGMKLKINNVDENIGKITPSMSSLKRLEKYTPIIREMSQKYGISDNLIKSVILTESAANEKAISHANAKGLMQLIDSTASDMGVRNVWDPKENIMGGTKYLAQMLRQYGGDLKLALAAYNAGPGNVNKYNGVPPFNETQNYIVRVMGYLNHFDG